MDSVSIDALVSLGFTQTEAKVYCAMVPEAKMNGYQIAKVLNLSRSSVYASLENLLDKGAIVAIPGETNEYAVVEPEELVSKILARYKKSAEAAKTSLEHLTQKRHASNYFLNIQGLTNSMETMRVMIHGARKEILLNSTMDIAPVKDALAEAIDRGVRVVLFSWINVNLYGLNIEFYCNNPDVAKVPEQRFSMVVDNSACLICSNDRNEFISYKQLVEQGNALVMPKEDGDFLGMKSDNRLMVNIIQEHIHFDIYLHKLRKKMGCELITPDIQLGTLMETGGDCS
mgnify:CR=1 FL=1